MTSFSDFLKLLGSNHLSSLSPFKLPEPSKPVESQQRLCYTNVPAASHYTFTLACYRGRSSLGANGYDMTIQFKTDLHTALTCLENLKRAHEAYDYFASKAIPGNPLAKEVLARVSNVIEAAGDAFILATEPKE